MNDQLEKNIESIVDNIFKKKEEAEMKKETEAALTQAAETITQLTESLEAKETEHQAAVATLQETIASLETQVNQMADDKKKLEDEKANFDKEKEELNKRAEAAEKELENIKKDQVAADRMSTLQTAGVVSTNAKDQQTKVREMSEEEFAAYKEELVSIKDSIIKQLEANASQTSDNNAQASADAEAVAAAAKEKELALAKVLESRLAELNEAGAAITDATEIAKIKDMDDAAFASFKEELLASISPDVTTTIDPMRAIAAALNMEVKPNEDMIQKYRALGAALAESITKKSK